MIIVSKIESAARGASAELRGLVHSDNGLFDDFTIWWRCPAAYSRYIPETADAHLAAALLPAMRLNQDLRIEGRVSPRLLKNIEQYMATVAQWWPEFKSVKILADECTDPHETGELTAAFFSGGVDSLYTLLKNQHEISHLFFIHGFDMGLEDRRHYNIALQGVQNVANALGKEIVQVSTNLARLSGIVDWNKYHGTALTSVALGLQRTFRKVYVPSSYSYWNLFPWGSHPQTDPLWSTETTEIVHDGCEANRVGKIRTRIAASQIALDNLRVCNAQSEMYNCCVCEKCIRTMLCLQLAGALQASKAFPRPLTYAAVRNLNISPWFAKVYESDYIPALVEAGEDPRLIKALRFSLDKGWLWKLRYYSIKALGQIARNIDKHVIRRARHRPGFKPDKKKIVLKKAI